jgi:invasion protein IalB
MNDIVDPTLPANDTHQTLSDHFRNMGMFVRNSLLTLIAVGFFALPAMAQQAKQAVASSGVTLPGEASSLTEQHGDWTVSCTIAQGVKQCTFSQVLGNNGKRILSIQLRRAGDDKVGGLLLTQFGLKFDAGVRLTVDDKPLIGPLPFLTCVDSGCLVPDSLDANAIKLINSGTALKVSAVAVNGGQPTTLTLSLTGFTAALGGRPNC